jgi:hypothetical protein
MLDDAATLSQRAIARDVLAWRRAEGISVHRQLVRRLATPVRPAETVIELILDDTVVAVYAEQVEIRMPHRTASWPCQASDVVQVVADIARMLETG